jgi:hypothetical protein
MPFEKRPIGRSSACERPTRSRIASLFFLRSFAGMPHQAAAQVEELVRLEVLVDVRVLGEVAEALHHLGLGPGPTEERERALAWEDEPERAS